MQDEKITLRKTLGRGDVIFLGFGCTIGWAWVVMPSVWINNSGSLGAALGFLIGGLWILAIGFTYAELVAAMPKAGGEQIWTWRGLGKTLSFICAFVLFYEYSIITGWEAVAVTSAFEYLFPLGKGAVLYQVAGYDICLHPLLLGVGGTLFLTIINYRGIKDSAWFQKIIVVIMLIIGVTFVGSSLTLGNTVNMEPLMPNGWGGVIKTLVLVPFFLAGFDVIPQASEEMNIPPRTVGIYTVVTILIAVFWYVFVILGVSLALPTQELSLSSLASADAFTKLMGGNGIAGKILCLAGVCGVLSTWNALFLGATRLLFGMARAGQAPKMFAYIHPKYQTPTNAIFMVGAISIICPFVGRAALGWLADLASVFMVIAYSLVAFSFYMLRKREPEMERPYKAPGGRMLGAIGGVVGIIILALFLPGMPAALVWPYEWIVLLVCVILAAIFLISAKKSGSADLTDGLMSEVLNIKNPWAAK